MFIDITIEVKGIRQDIKIDSEQKIKEALQVLCQSGKMSATAAPDFYRSMLNQRLVSAYKTFADEGVFDGDILTAI